ncbi:MAG: low temperature requirement protein A [Phycisphaerales bacterium]|nr:low temperature requirement protein A [Phycisphaerales bacterium]
MLAGRPWRRPMVARDHAEQHRQASWLELLFDLSFVVAVAQAAIQLEHSLAVGHPGAGVIGYLVVFGAIWWAWMAFTWFANVFDCDDVPYRLLMIVMIVMIAGSLGLAAAVPQIAHLDFRAGVISYVIMRLAYVGQWYRVLRTRDPMWRPIALKIIVLTTINQVGWVIFLWVPQQWKLPVFAAWFAVDLATRFLSGWDARMGGHRHHIVERYGLFTVIVLGESIAAATIAVGEAVSAHVEGFALLMLALGGLIAVCSLWWIYFDFSTGGAPVRSRRAQFLWGYVHYFVFAAIAAIGAGLALSVRWLTEPHEVALPEWGVAMVVGVAVVTFLLTIALIEFAAEGNNLRAGLFLKLGASLPVIAAALGASLISLPGSVLLIGLTLAGIVVYGVVAQHRLHQIAR